MTTNAASILRGRLFSDNLEREFGFSATIVEIEHMLNALQWKNGSGTSASKK